MLFIIGRWFFFILMKYLNGDNKRNFCKRKNNVTPISFLFWANCLRCNVPLFVNSMLENDHLLRVELNESTTTTTTTMEESRKKHWPHQYGMLIVLPRKRNRIECGEWYHSEIPFRWDLTRLHTKNSMRCENHSFSATIRLNGIECDIHMYLCVCARVCVSSIWG